MAYKNKKIKQNFKVFKNVQRQDIMVAIIRKQKQVQPVKLECYKWNQC